VNINLKEPEVEDTNRSYGKSSKHFFITYQSSRGRKGQATEKNNFSAISFVCSHQFYLFELSGDAKL
jgi:hypothetical protein